MKAQGYTKETILGLDKPEVSYPSFEIGDTIAVSQKVREGSKERIQVFQGDVIAQKCNGMSSTFTVRKIGANSIAVERIYPFYSPMIQEIKVVRRGKVRRAKLFYLRDRVGKKARVKEKIIRKSAQAATKKSVTSA